MFLNNPKYKDDFFANPKIEPPVESKNFIRWLLYLLHPYRWQMGLLFLFQFCRGVFFVMTAYFISLFIAYFEKGRTQESYDDLWHFFTIYSIALVLACISVIFLQLFTYFRDRALRFLSVFSLNHISTLPVAWHETNVSGNQMQRILRGREGFDIMLRQLYFVGMPFLAALVGTIIAVQSSKAPLYFIPMYICFLLFNTIITIVMLKLLSRRINHYHENVEHTVGKVYEFMNAMPTVKMFNLRNHISGKATEYEFENHKRYMHYSGLNFIKWATLNLNAAFWLLLIIGIGLKELTAENISIATFSFLTFMGLTLWHRVEEVTYIIDEFVPNHSAFMRLVSSLRQKATIKDRPEAKPLEIKGGAFINYKSVGFAYGKNISVFKDLSLTIKKGEKVGFVGSSGAGKTSLMKLLVRFYDVNEGEITINDQNISAVTLESLRKSISVIPQDISLFNHTVLDNIRLGDLNATDDEVIQAAKKAHADEFIRDLSEGYKTIVGERGVRLSGGQRQRVAIARAILKNAPILILDEATSALDSESERYIQDSLSDLMKDKTVLAIAHRLSTLSNMDRIIVLQNGKIIEQGSHKELLAQGGHYANLWSLQSGDVLQDY